MNDLSNFSELQQKEQKFSLYQQNFRSSIDYQYLEMQYLENIGSIFCVESYCGLTLDGFFNDNHYTNMVPSPAEKKCGLFNIDTHNWTDIKPFKCFTETSKYFGCKLCSNYDNSVVYLFDNASLNKIRYTYLYDMVRNEWRTVSTDNSVNNMEIFWFDHQVLHGVQTKDEDEFCLYDLDLRDDTRKWIKNKVTFDELSLNEDADYRLFQ